MNEDLKLDFLNGLEELSQEELAEFLPQLNQAANNAKQQFVKGKKIQGLRERYEAESNSMKLGGLSEQQRIRKLSALKAKYRAQGLEVW
jgi:IS5 family transposase